MIPLGQACIALVLGWINAGISAVFGAPVWLCAAVLVASMVITFALLRVLHHGKARP